MRVSFLALFALTLASCDTYHHEQYNVSRAANVSDRAKIKHLLASIASSSGFHDCYPISRASHTVVFYCEMDVIPYSGAQLGARELDDSIVVDLLHSLVADTSIQSSAQATRARVSRRLWPAAFGRESACGVAHQ